MTTTPAPTLAPVKPGRRPARSRSLSLARYGRASRNFAGPLRAAARVR